MRPGRSRWFEHVERKEVDDWVSACSNLEVAGSRVRDRPRMTWRARLDGDMKDMGLRPGMAMNREKWRCSIMGRTSDPHKRGNNGRQTSSSSNSNSSSKQSDFQQRLPYITLSVKTNPNRLILILALILTQPLSITIT